MTGGFVDSVAAMEKKTSAIPWARVQGLMTATGINQAGLARRLNIATNVVTNWKRRGGVPYGRAPEIARALFTSIESLVEGPIPRRMALSRKAQRIMDRVREMDRQGRISVEVEHAVLAVLDLVDPRD